MPTIINSDYLQAVVSRANELQRNNPRLSPAEAIDNALTERARARAEADIHDAQLAAFVADASTWQTYLATLSHDERQAAVERAERGARLLRSRK